MKSAAFAYERPREVAQAVKLLVENENAKAAAGTQSLGPMLNLRVVQPALLVDLRHIEEMKAVAYDRESVTLGACVTHAQIEDGRVPDPTNGFMREVASNIAYRAVRNRGTIGGSLVHADPAADWPSALTLLGATAITSSGREIPVEKFITGLFETALSGSELLVSIRIPKYSAKARFGYWKFCRKAGEFPQAIGGALRDPERGETRAVIGATGGAPRLYPQAEDFLSNPQGISDDPYLRRLQAVAVQRALMKVNS